jgi:hypothetical protein
MKAALLGLLLIAPLLLATAPAASAQDAGPPAPAPDASVPPGPAPAPSTAAEAASTPAAPAPTAQGMVADSLAQDISTASYYELVTWCDQLGLDNSGSRKDLQARLARYYKVTLPEAPAPGRRSVTVRSARQSEYFTEKETGEKYVLLRGDVVVEVKDLKDGTLQVIKAASLTFNQTRRTMSAVGDVTYTLTRGGQTDTFTGQSLDFDLDSSEAVFYDGSTRRVIKRTTGGDVPYTFAGETITRVSNDTVILQKGALTTSETPEDPLYQIRAGTIWLLAPGEWAVQDAVLLIGRVPILYLPGFFWPGDDFFFNPNIGYKTREGGFLQTTTYLVGRKKREESPFSFLQLSSSGDAGYALEPHGLFLRKVPGVAPPKDDGHSLKLMLDAYSRLGAMAGIAGDFSPLTTFRTSVAVSRSIFLDPVLQYYTPFLPQVPTTYANSYSVGDQFWNSSYLFGLSVPFRYGLEGTLKAGGTGTYSLTAGFQYFSDPYFTSDFYTRSESGMFSALLAQPNAAQAATTPQQTNLSWDLSGNLDFTRMVNQPFIQNLSISNFNLKVTWLSSTPTTAQYSSDPGASDPGRTFYYPTSVTAPNISATMSGDIVSLGTAAAQPPAAAASPAAAAPGTTPPAPGTTPPAPGTTPPAPGTTPPGTTPAAPSTTPAAPAAALAAPDPGKGVHPLLPAVVPSSPPAKQAGPRIPFRATEALPNVQGTADVPATFKLSYQVQPRATLEHTFDTANWTTRQAVDYSIKYRTFETGGSSSMTAASSFLNNLADTSLTLSADSLWRYRFDPSANERGSADWPSTLLLDQQQDKVAFRTAFQGTVRPFPAVTELSTSSLQYKINARMYQIGLTPDTLNPYNPALSTVGPAWSPDAISEHSVASTLVVATPATNDSLGLTFQLPPLIPTMTGRLDAAAGVLRGRVQGGFAAPPQAPVVYQPLVVSAAVDMGASGSGAAAPAAAATSTAAGQAATGTTSSTTPPNTAFTASEELQFDVGGSVLTRSTSSMGYAGFMGTFVAQNTGVPNQLEPATVKVGYESPWDPAWFWKDRLKVTPGLKTHWYMNLQNPIDNLLDFSPAVTVTLFQNLDLTFSSTSNNTRTYLYFPSLVAQVNRGQAVQSEVVDPLADLWRSFNFLNNDDRRRSGFKIQAISLKAVQHFPDWDASVEYTGSPQLVTHTNPSGTQFQQNEWSPTFSIQVQWHAFSEIKSTIHQEYTGTTAVPSLR